MAGFADWQMEPAVAAGMELLGWHAELPEVRDVVPPILRGGNAIVILPPAPTWAAPAVAGLAGQTAKSGRILILAAPSQLGEWALTLGALLETTSLQVDLARDAATTLAAADVVIASPERALERHTRSALHPEEFRAIVFAWPELWHADQSVTALLQDFAKDSQRLVLTAQRDQLDGPGGLVERYARKALVLASVAVEPASTAPRATSVRSVATSWSGRSATVASALAAIGEGPATIWTADERDHQLIRRALGSVRPGLHISARGVPAAGAVLCYDPPSAQQLAELGAVGEVTLLVPPGCEQHVAQIAPTRRPMQLDSPASAVLARDEALRDTITRTVASGDLSGPLYALAPLFERNDPQSVAAALFVLWQAAATKGTASVPVTAPHTATLAPASNARGVAAPAGGGAVAKLWIGAGKKDEATVADFVAVLVREVGVERSRIGRIELRDTFALVEVPAADAEAIVQRLSGITIRRRKLTARIDQGRGASGGDRRPPRR